MLITDVSAEPPAGKGKNKLKETIGIQQTGQSISYAIGDDGDWQMGVPLPVPRFTDNENGTVTDNLTGFIWLKDANCFGEKDWYDALSDCNNLAEGQCGLTDGSIPGDWRMPNVREMLSLIDYGYYDPALTPNHPFENVPGYPGRYWISTTMANNPYEAMHVPIVNGAVNGMNKLDNVRFVWPVKGGN